MLWLCISVFLGQAVVTSGGTGSAQEFVTTQVEFEPTSRLLRREDGIKGHVELSDVFVHRSSSNSTQLNRDRIYGAMSFMDGGLSFLEQAPGTDSCKMTTSWCCDSNNMNPSVYLDCVNANCGSFPGAPIGECSKYGACTVACSFNCCCLIRTVISVLIKAYRVFVAYIVALIALWTSYAEGAAGADNSTNGTAPSEEQVRKNALIAAMFNDIILWFFSLPIGAQLFFWAKPKVIEKVKSYFPKKAIPEGDENVRSGDYEKDGEEKPVDQAELQEKINSYFKPEEQARLGGLEAIVITKVLGISRMMYFLSDYLSLGLYHTLVEVPEVVNVAVLGKGGRICCLKREPLSSPTMTAVIFRATGVVMITQTTALLTFLKVVETGIILARESSDPATQAAASSMGPLAKHLVGKCFVVTIIATIILWFFSYFSLQLQVQGTWATNDKKDFYETKDACCGQYFRSGSRGPLPGITKRRHQGGLRLFFGPYPTADIFGILGAGFETLKNMEPMQQMPVDSADPHPQSGSVLKSPEQQAGQLQLIIGLINVALGSVGTFFLNCHLFNLFVNLQTCPVTHTVQPCVKNGDCTYMARTPWFQWYLTLNEIRSADQVAKDQMLSSVTIHTLGSWLGITNVGDSKAAAYQIAKATCNLRVNDLVTGPNSTIFAPFSDVLGKFSANCYLHNYYMFALDVQWDDGQLNCDDCVFAQWLLYFSNLENVVEILSTIALVVTTYYTAVVYGMMSRKLANCPMVDLQYSTNPAQISDIDVHQLEAQALNMMGTTFSQRFQFAGVPPHILEIEKKLAKDREEGVSHVRDNDPWSYNEKADKFEDWDLASPLNARQMIVSRKLLGLIDGEEIVAAWAEPPGLTSRQVFIIVGGFLAVFLLPLTWAFYKGAFQCMLESVIMGYLHWQGCVYFIFKRRPQAGFVMTSRRLFQITRRPAYKDICGKVEPLIKLDVLLHNSAILYGCMQMESYIAWHRRLVARITKRAPCRRGTVTVRGVHGIFKMWRVRGDMRDIFTYFSTISLGKKMPVMNPGWGQGLMLKEKEDQCGAPQDPACTWCCCPYSPPPQNMSKTLLERYLVRKKGEKDVYGRQLAMRPATCGKICCGKGCRCACTCCPCCEFHELLQEFVVTNMRILVEQRTVQRYCRITSACNKVPNIRATFLVLEQASAYVCLRTSSPIALTNSIRTDLCFKLLAKGAREYPSGLMMHQSPYQKVHKSQMPMPDLIYVTNICAVFDNMTQQQAEVEDDENSDEEDELEIADEDDQDMLARDENIGALPEKGKGKGKGKSKGQEGKSGGGKGAEHHGDGKGKGKHKGEGKGKGGASGSGSGK